MKARLLWVDDGLWSDAGLPGLSARVRGYPGDAVFEWSVGANGRNEIVFGETATLDDAKAAAEAAAHPMVERLIARHEAALAALRAALG